MSRSVCATAATIELNGGWLVVPDSLNRPTPAETDLPDLLRRAFPRLIPPRDTTPPEPGHKYIVVLPVVSYSLTTRGLVQLTSSTAFREEDANMSSLVAALTYNPITDEMYSAEKGGGAFLNNKRIRVAQRRDIHDTLVSYEVPHRGGKDLPLSRAEISVLQARVVGIRGTGSAALSLAYVAAGRFDAMVCRNIKPWDIAAGVLIVREAGGFVADPDSEKNPMETGNILATNADLLPQFKDALSKAREK